MKKFWSIILLGTIAAGVYMSDRSSFTNPILPNVAQGQELTKYDYTSDLYAYLKDNSNPPDAELVETPSQTQEETPKQTVKQTKTGASSAYATTTGQRFVNQRALNSDTIGWLQIPDTNINYPIMSYKDNQYYLNHDPNKNYNKCGSVFMDCGLNGSFGKITLLHGHNIKDGNIFSQLDRYTKEHVFKAGNIIKVFDGTTERSYMPFSVFYIDANKESIPLQFKYQSGYNDYFETLKKRSMYEVETGTIKEVLLLQTCAYVYDKNSGKDGRLILACYRVDE